MKYSRQRELIREAVERSTHHPTADAIYQEVRKKEPNISLATVYRNLRTLEQAGEIMKINGDFAEDRYDGFAHNHAHFVCKKCKKIVDTDIDGNLKLRILSACPVKADDFYVVFTGVCDDCKNKNQE